MRAPAQSRSGMTLLEVVIATSLLSSILLAGGSVLRTSATQAAATVDAGVAASRVQRALEPIADYLRRASLATVQGPTGQPFSDGSTFDAVRLRVPLAYTGAVQLAPPVIIRLEIPAGSTTGNVVLEDGANRVILARGLTTFSISRTGQSFTIRAGSRAGPPDDRSRLSLQQVTILPRNP